MSPLRQPMLAALHLRGKGERTQEASVREGRLLAPCSHQSPDRIAAPALQRYFLHRQNVDHLAPASRSEEHTSELQSQSNLVCRLLLEKKNQVLRSSISDGTIPGRR